MPPRCMVTSTGRVESGLGMEADDHDDDDGDYKRVQRGHDAQVDDNDDDDGDGDDDLNKNADAVR